jgi:hypothetical protein
VLVVALFVKSSERLSENKCGRFGVFGGTCSSFVILGAFAQPIDGALVGTSFIRCIFASQSVRSFALILKDKRQLATTRGHSVPERSR